MCLSFTRGCVGFDVKSRRAAYTAQLLHRSVREKLRSRTYITCTRASITREIVIGTGASCFPHPVCLRSGSHKVRLVTAHAWVHGRGLCGNATRDASSGDRVFCRPHPPNLLLQGEAEGIFALQRELQLQVLIACVRSQRSRPRGQGQVCVSRPHRRRVPQKRFIATCNGTKFSKVI